MSARFQRGLSKKLILELLDGPGAIVLRACLDAGLDARLRDDYLNLYFQGRSLARIVGRRRGPPKLEVHHKYLSDDRIGAHAASRGQDYCTFDVDDALAEAYAVHLHDLIQRARHYVGSEEDVELQLLARNGSSATVCCFDRQIQVPGIRRKLDLIGLFDDRVPSLVAIEVKRYPDARIQDVPRQLHEYLEIFDPKREGLRADVAASYQMVCEQLRTLGLPAPDSRQIESGMPVEGLAVVSNYNPRSRLLPRAHALATTFERPIYLWQPPDREFLIPDPARWTRMGAA